MTAPSLPRMYADLAHWWPLLSPPSEYTEEAEDFLPLIMTAPDARPKTLLELGCGGGSLAHHLKGELALTLSDVSSRMLDVSRAQNPECEHVQGDMRSLALGRTFDVVFLHDAVMYATDVESLGATIATAFRHCRPGGAVVIAPDCVKETFVPATECGGNDAPDGRGLRYLEWTWDPDPTDSVARAVFSLLLREPDGRVGSELDEHLFGLFPRAEWLALLDGAGFRASTHPDRFRSDVFVGKKPR